MDKRGVGVNNDAKNKRKGNQQGQYSAILTEQACWTRREILSGQDRPILPSWVANQKAGFASNPAICETRKHHKILFSTLIVPSRVPQSSNPDGYFWHPTFCAFFQSRISFRFCYKIRNPEFRKRKPRNPKNLILGNHLLTLFFFLFVLGTVKNVIMVADSFYDEIYLSTLDSSDTTIVPLPVQNLTNPIGVDFDPFNNRIYWTDYSLGTVKRSVIDGSNQETIRSGIAGPYGIALDLVAENVYWISRLDYTIEVSKLDGSNRKVLVSNLGISPDHIALDTSRGLVKACSINRQRGSVKRGQYCIGPEVKQKVFFL